MMQSYDRKKDIHQENKAFSTFFLTVNYKPSLYAPVRNNKQYPAKLKTSNPAFFTISGFRFDIGYTLLQGLLPTLASTRAYVPPVGAIKHTFILKIFFSIVNT